MSKRNLDRAMNLLEEMNSDFFGNAIALNEPVGMVDTRAYISRILLERVRPDPVQPRRVLPDELHTAFHTERITPINALREIVRVAKISARQKGRPFENVLDILGKPEEQDVEITDYSPEERLLHELVTLAVSIRNDGQVNPITVVEVEHNGYPFYRIETGERRYWASYLLNEFFPDYSGDRMIDCVIIPPERYSPFRQARENSAREGLSAIAMARQAALLVITVNNAPIPDQAVNNDFYRQALEMRIPREFADLVYNAMGGIGRAQFSLIKNLLRLSDEALELADRHHIEEKKLRYVLQIPELDHVEVIRQIISYNLTGSQVKELCESVPEEQDGGIEIIDEPSMPIPPHIKKLVRSTQKDVLVHDLVRAHVEDAKGDTTAAYLRIRQMAIVYQDALNMLGVSLEEQ